jgi:hypothetical protein
LAYLYRHIRLDTNKVFYIGIGEDKTSPIFYKRAYSKQSRNKYWNNIISKTPYNVEILLDDLTWDEACNKEIEFIKLYGRADLNRGSLVNMTDGGDGLYNPSNITRNKKSKSMKDFHKHFPQSSKNRVNKIDWEKLSKKRSLTRNHIQAGKKTSLTHKNNPEIGKNIGDKLRNNKERGLKISSSLCKPIIQLDKNNNIIFTYSSIKEASELNNFNKGAICNNLKGVSKSAYGYKWQYK